MVVTLHRDAFTSREWRRIEHTGQTVLDTITQAGPCRVIKAASGHKITVVQYL